MITEIVWHRSDYVHIRYSGQVVGAEVVGSILEVGGDDRFDSLRIIIADLSSSNRPKTQIKVEDIEKAAAFIAATAKSNSHIRLATVLGQKDEEREALANLFEMLMAEVPWDVEIFYSLEEAQNWLQGTDWQG